MSAELLCVQSLPGGKPQYSALLKRHLMAEMNAIYGQINAISTPQNTEF